MSTMLSDQAPAARTAARSRPILRLLIALVIGALGGSIFFAFGLPASWLTGSATAVSIAAIAGLSVVIPKWMRSAAMIFLGAVMGSSVTPDTFAQITSWPISLAGLFVVVILMMLAVSLYLERFQGFDPATARLACIPGNIAYVLVLAEESSADTRRVAIVQVFRLAVLLSCLPFIFDLMGYEAVDDITRANVWQTDFSALGLLLGLAVVGGFIFERIGFPAGLLCGAMFATALSSGSGLLAAHITGDLMAPALVVMGAVTGANFVGTDRGFLIKTLGASLGAIMIGAAIALAVAAPVAHWMNVTLAQVFLAYAPGGADTMSILALALGLEPAFVVSHHVIRMFALGAIVPLWLRFHKARQAKQ